MTNPTTETAGQDGLRETLRQWAREAVAATTADKLGHKRVISGEWDYSYAMALVLAAADAIAARLGPSEEQVKRAAQAIFDAENGIDGDRIGDMLYGDFRINGPVDNALAETMEVCRLAARAALSAAALAPLAAVEPSEEQVERLRYLAECVEVHADKFPVPAHMREHAKNARAIAAALSETEKCPVCMEPLKAGDTCAIDIELGTCHAACLDGSPTVNLDTGEEVAGPIPTFAYDADPPRAALSAAPLSPAPLASGGEAVDWPDHFEAYWSTSPYRKRDKSTDYNERKCAAWEAFCAGARLAAPPAVVEPSEDEIEAAVRVWEEELRHFGTRSTMKLALRAASQARRQA
jgi:hypothetical protein